MPTMPSPTPLPALRLTRAVNNAAELELLVMLGDGAFELGVHYVCNLWRERRLHEVRDGYPGPLGMGVFPERVWVEAVFEEDARLIDRVEGGFGPALSVILWAALERAPADVQRRAAERAHELRDLPSATSSDDAFAHWHAPQRERGGRQGLLDGYPSR